MKRLINIDILRGIAAISVTYFHLSATLSKEIAKTGSYGFLGVEIFFVVSGFILPYSMHMNNYRVSGFFRLLGKRIVRIDPPYFLMILITLVLMYLTGREMPDTLSLLAHIGYLNNIIGKNWLSPIFWTLALEFQFYIILGILYHFLIKKSDFLSLFIILLIISSSFFLPNSFLPHYFVFFCFRYSTI